MSLISRRSPQKLLSCCTPTWRLFSVLRNLKDDDITWKRSIPPLFTGFENLFQALFREFVKSGENLHFEGLFWGGGGFTQNLWLALWIAHILTGGHVKPGILNFEVTFLIFHYLYKWIGLPQVTGAVSCSACVCVCVCVCVSVLFSIAFVLLV